MHLSSALLLSAVAPLAHAFTLTSPDTSNPINISEPVVFEWTNDDDEGHQGHPWLHLDFVSNGLFWSLNSNNRIDIRNVSSWTWDAPSWTEDMREVDQVLYAGKNNWFNTYLHDVRYRNQTGGWYPLETEKFEIEGYDNLENGAGAMTPSWVLGLGAGVVAVVAGAQGAF